MIVIVELCSVSHRMFNKCNENRPFTECFSVFILYSLKPGIAPADKVDTIFITVLLFFSVTSLNQLEQPELMKRWEVGGGARGSILASHPAAPDLILGAPWF